VLCGIVLLTQSDKNYNWEIVVRFPARARNVSVVRSIPTGSGVHSASCSLGIRDSFPGLGGGKLAGTWSWKHTSMYCRVCLNGLRRVKYNVDLYLTKKKLAIVDLLCWGIYGCLHSMLQLMWTSDSHKIALICECDALTKELSASVTVVVRLRNRRSEKRGSSRAGGRRN